MTWRASNSCERRPPGRPKGAGPPGGRRATHASGGPPQAVRISLPFWVTRSRYSRPGVQDHELARAAEQPLRSRRAAGRRVPGRAFRGPRERPAGGGLTMAARANDNDSHFAGQCAILFGRHASPPDAPACRQPARCDWKPATMETKPSRPLFPPQNVRPLHAVPARGGRSRLVPRSAPRVPSYASSQRACAGRSSSRSAGGPCARRRRDRARCAGLP